MGKAKRALSIRSTRSAAKKSKNAHARLAQPRTLVPKILPHCSSGQAHGRVYTTGHALMDVIEIAAVYGFAREPSLIAAMAPGK